tara:strand:+ start:942 stop:2297 length:1356 start_codon:yes stop_codon:yes gene_type:complete
MAYLNNQSQQVYYDNDDLYGNYQFISLKDIIDQFMVVYVGEDKIINKARRTDVAFHAMRGMQEFSFDVFKSCKSLEVEIGATLVEPLPQDYVNYTKISWVDSAGIKHPLYPTLSNTSNPKKAPFKDGDDNYILQAVGTLDSNLNIVGLDKIYDKIVVGMLVSGTNIPPATYVLSVRNSTTQTVIELADGSNVLTAVGVTPTFDGDETLTFTNVDGSAVSNLDKYVSLDANTWSANDNKITVSSLANAQMLEVGMLVSNLAFSPGTTIIDIQGTVITTSTMSYFDSVSEPEINFTLPAEDSTAWSNYKSHVPSANTNDDYEVDDDIYDLNIGQRYGLDPYHAQVNGSYYIDCDKGKIHFSSNIAGKTVIIDYISDGLGTDEEMRVHKMAEEAMYKWITHAVLASKANTPEYLVQRLKKERFAETRKAKLRLSNIKLEELTQMLRAKSKWIKH